MTRYDSFGALLVAGLLLFALVAWVLGPRGRRDGVLYAGALVLAGFAVGGSLGVVRGERGAAIYLVVGALLAWQLRPRWRALARSSESPPAT